MSVVSSERLSGLVMGAAVLALFLPFRTVYRGSLVPAPVAERYETLNIFEVGPSFNFLTNFRWELVLILTIGAIFIGLGFSLLRIQPKWVALVALFAWFGILALGIEQQTMNWWAIGWIVPPPFASKITYMEIGFYLLLALLAIAVLLNIYIYLRLQARTRMDLVAMVSELVLRALAAYLLAYHTHMFVANLTDYAFKIVLVRFGLPLILYLAGILLTLPWPRKPWLLVTAVVLCVALAILAIQAALPSDGQPGFMPGAAVMLLALMWLVLALECRRLVSIPLVIVTALFYLSVSFGGGGYFMSFYGPMFWLALLVYVIAQRKRPPAVAGAS